MSCSTLRERAAWSSPNASQVSCFCKCCLGILFFQNYVRPIMSDKTHHKSSFKREPQRHSQSATCWGNTPKKINVIRIDAPRSRQPLVKGERLIRYEVNAAIPKWNSYATEFRSINVRHGMFVFIATLKTQQIIRDELVGIIQKNLSGMSQHKEKTIHRRRKTAASSCWITQF